ncbi:MAG: hypothetical protein M1816_002228 [Peltula sp. TS41687]|nr:MAG: hypothetical protein M1816_002228 [Peltula sp. TS41687]
MPDNMYDHNVFTVVTAYDKKNKASSAFKLQENSKWFCEAIGGVAEEPIIDSREATPAEDPQPDDEEASTVDRLVVTFDKLLENLQNGVQLGTNPSSSHILLGHRGTKGTSAKQCNITVDDDLCIWLHDFHSAHGTAVGHDGQNQKGVRKRETWILAYQPGTRNPFKEITIHSGGLAVNIEFPNHTTAHSQYVENLRAFVKKCKDAAEKRKEEVPAVDGLGLDSEPTTQAPSEAQTDDERVIYYHEKDIGSGTFGEVHRVIRVRDGKVLAAKTFKPPANKRKLGEVDPAWLTGIRREFTLMKETPHPNVMEVFEFRETPEPMIVMAYYPIGNIVDAGIVGEEAYISALGQILDGLSHLHAKGVVHRDLKPENFLVEKNPFFRVVISDFGFAKVVTSTTLLTTFCGTLKYLAPEVFPGLSNGHGPAVDVWSLGVIALEWIYGIPMLPTVPMPRKLRQNVRPEKWHQWIEIWSNCLLVKLADEDDDDQMVEILLGMIEVSVSNRWDTKRCLEQGFENGLFKRRAVDGLVMCANDPVDLVLPTEERDDGTETPTAASPPSVEPSLHYTHAAIDPGYGALGFSHVSLPRLQSDSAGRPIQATVAPPVLNNRPEFVEYPRSFRIK